MCLTINKLIHKKFNGNGILLPLVAEQDIHVGKALTYYTAEHERRPENVLKYFTPYQFASIIINERLPQRDIVSSIMQNKYSELWESMIGYHSHAIIQFPILSNKSHLMGCSNGRLTVCGGGSGANNVTLQFSSYVNYISNMSTVKVAIIPKGTKYYLGTDGDVVSETLIITDFDISSMLTEIDVKDKVFRSPEITKRYHDDIIMQSKGMLFCAASDSAQWYQSEEDGHVFDFVKNLNREQIKEELGKLALV